MTKGRAIVASNMEADYDPAPGRNGIQSVEMAMRVLESLAAGGGPMSLSAVALASGMAGSKVHRYLVSLGRIGLTSQDPLSGLYDFGHSMRRLGAESLRRTNEVAVTSTYAQGLRDATGHSVDVAVWGDRGPIVVSWAYGSRPLPLTVRVGATLPLLSSSIGQVFLAYLSDSITEAALRSDLATAVGNGWTEKRVMACQAETRKRGFAVTSGGVIPGIVSVAAPVFAATDPMPLALSLVVPEADGRADDLSRLTGQLKSAAAAASRELGHEPT